MENNLTLQKIKEYTYFLKTWQTQSPFKLGLHPDSALIPNGIGYRMNDIRYRIVCMNMRIYQVRKYRVSLGQVQAQAATRFDDRAVGKN